MRIKRNRRASGDTRSSSVANARMRDRSFLITCAIPGRMTFTATSSPLSSVASWTCASDADARLLLVNFANMSERGFPISLSMVEIAVAPGNGGTRSWSLASSSAYSGGNKSLRVERSCPNLINTGPRCSMASLHRAASDFCGRGSKDVGNRYRVQCLIFSVRGIVSSRNRSRVARICKPLRKGVNLFLPLRDVFVTPLPSTLILRSKS